MRRKAFLSNELKSKSEKGGHKLNKRPRPTFFWIQPLVLGIYGPILPGSQMDSVTFSELDSICEKRSDSEKNFEKLEVRSTFYQKLDSEIEGCPQG